ncbi:MAG TPA: metalloregulator ArsR/SmtB family transcription factor [Rudaea sp.]|nr:metalloregulator ArsR/SmtB family transcription factor [Rudaea sp.]
MTSLPSDADLDAMRGHADAASRLLKALGNAQRLRILCLLVDRERSVNEINEHLPELSQSALSQHLARLREEGLAQTRRESQTIWYAMTPGPAQSVIATLYEVYCVADEQSAPRQRNSARARKRHPRARKSAGL